MEKNKNLLVLGQNVRRLRRDAKLTQEELAARAGLSANYIGETERGVRNPSALALFAIAQSLTVEPGELFGGFTPHA